MLEVVRVIMIRDNVSERVALEQVQECRAEIEAQMDLQSGYCPEDIVMDELGLEPDYLFEILGA